MPNASSNLADIKYVVESVFGTTPASPALKPLRYKGESMNPGFQFVRSEEIRSDRNDVDLIKVGHAAGGNVEFELSYASFDDWLEAVMCSTWTVAVGDRFTLVNGVLQRSYTVQKRFTDVTQFLNFT